MTVIHTHKSIRNSDARDPYREDLKNRGTKKENSFVNTDQHIPVNTAPGNWLLKDLRFEGNIA